MSGNVYAVVGTDGSGHGTVALDLAGAYAAAGSRTVLVELAPAGEGLLETLDPGSNVALRASAGEVLSGESDPVAAVTPVAVDRLDVDRLGILPTDPDRKHGDVPSLDGLGDALSALVGTYDVVVLDVGAEGGGEPTLPADPVDGAVVTTDPDAGTARTASGLAGDLADRGVAVAGAVVTDCEDEADLWRAKARLATDVAAVVPPVRPDRVEAVGDRVGTVRDELVAEGSAPGGPDDGPDSRGPGDGPTPGDGAVRSLSALVAGDSTRVTVASAPGTGEGSGSTGAEGTGPADAERSPTAEGDQSVTADGEESDGGSGTEGTTTAGPGTENATAGGSGSDGAGVPADDSWTAVPVDLDDGSDAGDGSDDATFRFGDLPGSEEGAPDEDPERGDGSPGDADAEAVSEVVADLLDGGDGREPADADRPTGADERSIDWEPPGEDGTGPSDPGPSDDGTEPGSLEDGRMERGPPEDDETEPPDDGTEPAGDDGTDPGSSGEDVADRGNREPSRDDGNDPRNWKPPDGEE